VYGLITTFSIAVSIFIASRLVKKKKLDENILYGGMFWVILAGIIGARIYHVIHYWDWYSNNPTLILTLQNGGLAIYGAIIFGVATGLIYLKIKKQRIMDWIDIGGLLIPLGQAVGRWANYFNQELYGAPTSLPWGIYISPQNRIELYKDFEKFHPLFLYESLLDLVLFLFLLWVFNKKTHTLKKGSIFFLYLIGYGLIRFFMEFFKIDPWKLLGLNTAQIISILLVLIGIYGIRKINPNDKTTGN